MSDLGGIIVADGNTDFRCMPSRELFRYSKKELSAPTARKCYFNHWKHKPYSVTGRKYPKVKVVLSDKPATRKISNVDVINKIVEEVCKDKVYTPKRIGRRKKEDI